TYASGDAVVAGSAALIAARIVATKARRLAAHLLEVSDADLELADGVVRVVGAPDRRLSLADLATACAPGSPLPEGMEPGLEATHYFAAPRATFASGVHVATVEIERETGRIAIIDYTVVSDAGRVINPLIVEGQIHGGVAQGVGGALYEELVYDEQGQPRTQSLLEYVMPTAEQVPSMKIANLVTPSPLNPLGVKGIGEAGALAPPAAITAAVEDALRLFPGRAASGAPGPTAVADPLFQVGSGHDLAHGLPVAGPHLLHDTRRVPRRSRRLVGHARHRRPRRHRPPRYFMGRLRPPVDVA